MNAVAARRPSTDHALSSKVLASVGRLSGRIDLQKRGDSREELPESRAGAAEY